MHYGLHLLPDNVSKLVNDSWTINLHINCIAYRIGYTWIDYYIYDTAGVGTLSAWSRYGCPWYGHLERWIVRDGGNGPDIAVTINCDAPDDEILLVDWLNSIIFEMATRKMLFGLFDVHISGHHLQATAWGEKIKIAKHKPAVEVKGATYTDLRVYRTDNGKWITQCVVDVWLVTLTGDLGQILWTR